MDRNPKTANEAIPLLTRMKKSMKYDPTGMTIVEEQFYCITCALQFNLEKEMLDHLEDKHKSVITNAFWRMLCICPTHFRYLFSRHIFVSSVIQKSI